MWACTPCASSDPTTDTVKVQLPPTAPWDKENLAPVRGQQQEAEAEEAKRRKEAEEAQRRAEAEVARQRAEAEAARRRAEAEEAQRRAEEARQLALAEERKRAEAEAAERAQEEAIRRDQEEQRLREEAAKAERARQEKEAADRVKVDAFLKKHGYAGANVKRSRMFRTSYPLHEAVRENNAELVVLLLLAGADPAAKDSSGHTAQQLAEKAQKNGSHAPVLRALAAGA